MTRPAVPVTERSPERGRSRQISGTIGRAAILIGALAATGRVIGFGRQLVFARTVGDSCLGSAYTTANLVPNIIYDIVLGGALASIMVPVLAGSALAALLACCCAVIAFGVMAYAQDRGDLRAVLTTVRRRAAS